MYNAFFNLGFSYLIQTPGSSSKATEMGPIQSKIVDFLVWIVNKLPALFGAIAVVLVTFVIARLVNNAVIRSLSRQNADDQVTLLVGRSAHTLVIIIGVTIALKVIGIDITSIVGLFGLGFGFAMQDIIKNFVSGALILIQEPFRIGDVIQVGSFVGKVEAIEARSTNIKTFDGQRVIVPNADVFSQTVTNFSAHPERRMEIAVGVHYNTNLQYAKEVVLQVLSMHNEVLVKPKPVVFFDAFSDSSISLLVKFWVDKDSHILAIRSELLNEIKVAFERAGINIPYPIRTLEIADLAQQKELDKKNINQNAISEFDDYGASLNNQELNANQSLEQNMNIPSTQESINQEQNRQFVVERNEQANLDSNPFQHTDMPKV